MLNINIIQDENRKLIGPPIRLLANKVFRLSVMSFRCVLEESLTRNTIFYLKCKIISQNETNPLQIICFISGRRGSNSLTYVPPQNISYKLTTIDFIHENFTLHSLDDHSEIEFSTAALQIRIGEINKTQRNVDSSSF